MSLRGTPRWQFAVGLIFTVAALALLAVSFATDHWLETTVNRDGLKTDLTAASAFDTTTFTTNPLFFTRNRGLFRTCYEGNETVFLDSRTDVLDGKCLREQGYEIPDRRESTINYPAAYERRFHLMRTHVAFFILSMFFYAVSVIMGLFGIYKMQINLTQVTGLIIFAAAFLGAGGMAVFHGYDYIEKNDFDVNLAGAEDFYSYWKDLYPALDSNAEVAYGYSYMLGWISVGLGALGGILFLCAAISLRDAIQAERKRDKKSARKDKKKSREAFDNTAYNPYAAYAPNPYTPNPYAAYYDQSTAAVYPTLPTYDAYNTGTYPAITY